MKNQSTNPFRIKYFNLRPAACCSPAYFESLVDSFEVLLFIFVQAVHLMISIGRRTMAFPLLQLPPFAGRSL